MKTILAVDDNWGDLLLLEQALSPTRRTHRLITATDGADAKDCLRGLAETGELVSVDMIFTDLRMPKCDGLELLAWLKNQTVFKEIPVAIVSSSCNPKELSRAFELGAVACVSKPPEATALSRLLNHNPYPLAGSVVA